MHSGLQRKVRHPLGDTEPFEVGRGVAQGAVESPWVYSNFIEGLTTRLKAAGLGVVVAGRRVPLLLYADDIVMLAASQRELVKMNAIATEYARQHRFQFNGEKSGVVLFGASEATRKQVAKFGWRLGGEEVEVKAAYEYLGTWIESDGLSWRKA